jgi:diguanylate cyclase (GGDEF)-like protein
MATAPTGPTNGSAATNGDVADARVEAPPQPIPIRRLGPTGRLGTVAPGHGYSRRDRDADERDTEADERDREADQRDREADRRDRKAEIASLDVSNGSADLHERRQLVVARHRAASERAQAALDRAAASADRRRAAFDRQVATAEREDTHEERLILSRDELTGVLRRGAGLIELEREVARSGRSGDSFVIAFVDLDGLKRINDEGGHASGDQALRDVGEALQTGMRTYDVTLRYGGDEFVCILPGLGIAEATARFEALQADLAAGAVPVPVTFGLAEWKRGEDIADLLARADADLYQVRRSVRSDSPSGLPASHDDGAAVAAHTLLNSSAVVSMGITTLLAQDDELTSPERRHLLERMLAHATRVDHRLKGITRGVVRADEP